MSTFALAPTGVRIALTLGIAGSGFASGAILGFSTFAVPALLQVSSASAPSSPSTVARTWDVLYNRGKGTMPYIAATSSSAFAYLAYTLRENPSNYTKLFSLAGLLTISIVPFTLLAMSKTNNSLVSKAKEEATGVVDVKSLDETKDLAVKWMWLNAGRATLPLAGCLVGIVALLS